VEFREDLDLLVEAFHVRDYDAGRGAKVAARAPSARGFVRLFGGGSFFEAGLDTRSAGQELLEERGSERACTLPCWGGGTFRRSEC